MSTTLDPNIALKYSQDWDASRNLSYIHEISCDGLNRGAMIQWLSQYPEESEVLFGPLTGLNVHGDAILHGTVRHIIFRPTSNQHSIRMEQLVGQRKLMHCNLLEEEKMKMQREQVHPMLQAELELELTSAENTAVTSCKYESPLMASVPL